MEVLNASSFNIRKAGYAFFFLMACSFMISCTKIPHYRDLNHNGKMDPYENPQIDC